MSVLVTSSSGDYNEATGEMLMLDDLKYLHVHDPQDALGSIAKQAEQFVGAANVGGQQAGDISNVVYVSGDGWAVPAQIAKALSAVTVPFEIVSGSSLPSYVGQGTLVICASYSSEGAHDILARAAACGARVAVITADEQLQQYAESKGYWLGVLPEAVPRQYIVFSALRLLLEILRLAGVLAEAPLDFAETAQFLRKETTAWLPTVAASQNQAKQLALEAMGRSMVVYSGPLLMPAAYRWKNGFNEQAKQLAWQGVYPEFGGAELLGWSKQPADKPYWVVELRSGLEPKYIQYQFEVAERVLSGMRPAPHSVAVQGRTVLEQLAWAIVLGDFVSVYLAILNGVDPLSVDLKTKFKKALQSKTRQEK